MKTTTISHGICGACSKEFDSGGHPQFFMPVPNRTMGTEPSKRVCPDCFIDFLKTNSPDGVDVDAIPRDDFYSEASHAGDLWTGADE